jgi:hypothetical protein
MDIHLHCAELHHSSFPVTHDRHVEARLSRRCRVLSDQTCHYFRFFTPAMSFDSRQYPNALCGRWQWGLILEYWGGRSSAPSGPHQWLKSCRDTQTWCWILSWSSWLFPESRAISTAYTDVCPLYYLLPAVHYGIRTTPLYFTLMNFIQHTQCVLSVVSSCRANHQQTCTACSNADRQT